jgi:hypothetical protein
MSQSEINFTTPPNVPAGTVTAYTMLIGANSYTYSPPATWAPGSAQSIPFAAFTPPFVPVAGTAYAAGLEATDSAGTSIESNVFSWTQAFPIPAAPVITGVS